MKIAINRQHGGFGISNIAQYRLFSLERVFKLIDSEETPRLTWARHSPLLIWAIETTPNSDGEFAEIKIVDIPDGVDWQIEEYDGLEWVAEAHRTWE